MTFKSGIEKGAVSVATLDEAMMMTGFGVYNVLHMLMNGLIMLGVIMQSLALGYVLPAAQCDLGLSPRQQGQLAAIPFLAIILMSYFWGYLGDTRGRKPVMQYTMMVSAVLTVFTSFAPDLVSFAVLQFLSSIFMSGPTAVVYTFTGEFNNLRHRDKMVTFGSSFVGLGTVLLPAISWLILPLDFAYPIDFLNILYRPWRLLIVACALPYALGAVCLIFSPESPKFLNVMGRHEECLDVVRTIYSVNKRLPADTFPVKSLISDMQVKNVETRKRGAAAALLVSMKEQTLPLFKLPLLPWTCLTSFVQFGIFATCNGFYVWFPTVLNALANHGGEGATSICAILEADRAPDNGTTLECNDSMNVLTFQRSIYIGLVFSSMYIIVGFLVDLVGKKSILVVVLVVSGLCGVGAHLASDQQTAVILFAVFQMSGACIGLMNAVTVEMFPTKFRAMAICLAMIMGRVGSMVGSNLLGYLLNSHCGLSFYLFGSIIVLNGLVCLLLPGRKKSSKDKKMTVEPTECQTHEPE